MNNWKWWMAPILGWRRGYSVSVVEVGFNGTSVKEAKSMASEVLPTIESRLTDLRDRFPITVRVRKAWRI